MAGRRNGFHRLLEVIGLAGDAHFTWTVLGKSGAVGTVSAVVIGPVLSLPWGYAVAGGVSAFCLALGFVGRKVSKGPIAQASSPSTSVASPSRWDALADADLVNLPSLLFVHYQDANGREMSAPTPYIDFQFAIFNASVWDVELESYQGRFAGELGAFRNPPEQIHQQDARPRFSHGNHYPFRVRQYFEPFEAEDLRTRAAETGTLIFNLSAHFNVFFTIPDRPDVERFRIELPGGTIPVPGI